MTNVPYKANDTVPLKARLPVDDLNDASSVDFHMINEYESVVIKAGAVIDDADNAEVAYKWKSGETNREGTYEIKWEVTWDDGTVESFPKGENDEIHFSEDHG